MDTCARNGIPEQIRATGGEDTGAESRVMFARQDDGSILLCVEHETPGFRADTVAQPVVMKPTEALALAHALTTLATHGDAK